MKEIVLVGCPNSGKSTLYNRLTGAHVYTGNRPGVTTRPACAPLCDVGAESYLLTDLPGLYSLRDARTPDEENAAQTLRQKKYDLILFVADAFSLQRHLALATELAELGIPMILAVNRMDSFDRSGGKLLPDRLATRFGCPVIAVSALRGNGVQALLQAIRHGGKRSFAVTIANAQDGFTRAEWLLRDIYTVPHHTFTQAADRILLHPILGPVCLFSCLFALLYCSAFGPVAQVSTWMQEIFTMLQQYVQALLLQCGCSIQVAKLVCGSVFEGIGAVASFLPQTLFLFFGVIWLEQSGYLCRSAVLCETILKPIGLDGRATIPLLLGFACSVPAIASTDTLRSQQKGRAVTLIPFLPCSAKMPLCALLAGTLFAGHKSLFFIVFVAGFGTMLLCLLLYAAIERILKKNNKPVFFLELPQYHWPRLSEVWDRMREKCRDAIFRILCVVFICSVVLHIFSAFTITFQPAQNIEGSIIGALGNAVLPVLRPMGISSLTACIALLCGMFSKEATVAALATIAGQSGLSLSALLARDFPSLATAGAFLCFFLNAPPCPAALCSLSRTVRSGAGFVIRFCGQLLFAYFLSAILHLLLWKLC